MYRTAVIRKGRPTEHSTCGDATALRDVVFSLIRSEGSVITEADHTGLSEVIEASCLLAEAEGFAALEFGALSITVRPGTVPGTEVRNEDRVFPLDR